MLGTVQGWVCYGLQALRIGKSVHGLEPVRDEDCWGRRACPSPRWSGLACGGVGNNNTPHPSAEVEGVRSAGWVAADCSAMKECVAHKALSFRRPRQT